LRFYQLNEKTSFIENPYEHGLKFWQQLYEEHSPKIASVDQKQRKDEL